MEEKTTSTNSTEVIEATASAPDTGENFMKTSTQAPMPGSDMTQKLVIAVLSLVLLIGLGWYGYAVWYPQYLVKSFFNEHMALVRAQNFNGAYAQTTGSFQLETPLENYQRFMLSQGLANGDIPYKIMEAKPFTAPDLTKRATVLIELVGDTGARQPVTFKINRENGFYKVRLIEVPDTDGSVSWVGMRYPDDMSYGKDGGLTVTPPAAPAADLFGTTAPVAPAPVASMAPVQQAPVVAQQPSTDSNPYNWNTWESQLQISGSQFTPVTDLGVLMNASGVAGTHFILHVAKGDYVSAFDQLHPYFKQKETPTTYREFLRRTGIIENDDVIVNENVVNGQIVRDVRRYGNYYFGKTEMKIVDYSGGSDPRTGTRYFYVLAVSPVSADGINRQTDWKIISMATKEFAQANPGFFPF